MATEINNGTNGQLLLAAMLNSTKENVKKVQELFPRASEEERVDALVSAAACKHLGMIQIMLQMHPSSKTCRKAFREIACLGYVEGVACLLQATDETGQKIIGAAEKIQALCDSVINQNQQIFKKFLRDPQISKETIEGDPVMDRELSLTK